MLMDDLPNIVTELPGPNAKKILERRQNSIPDAIKPIFPLVVKRGAGAIVEDFDGNKFLDWIGGVGVLNVGYSNQEIIKAATSQMQDFFHVMMAVGTHKGYVEVAEEINRIAPLKSLEKRTMLVNCGAEAVENAIKIAKAATKRSNILVFSGAFHGRTSMTMAMTAKKKYAIGMGPFPEGIFRAKYPYLYRAPNGLSKSEAINYYVDDIYRVFDEGSPAESIACVVIEPILGEGGFIPAPIEYIKKLRKICDEKGILLVADEIQCGFGRSGKMFVSEYWAEEKCAPDILVCGKSIAGGLPLGAVVSGKELVDKLAPGTVGGTFCGNAVACKAALKVIETIEDENLLERANEIGDIVKAEVEEWKKELICVGDIRGQGCMLGIEIVNDRERKMPEPEIVKRTIREAFKNGLIVENAGTYGNVIRFLAPLVINDKQLRKGLKILKQAILISK